MNILNQYGGVIHQWTQQLLGHALALPEVQPFAFSIQQQVASVVGMEVNNTISTYFDLAGQPWDQNKAYDIVFTVIKAVIAKAVTGMGHHLPTFNHALQFMMEMQQARQTMSTPMHGGYGGYPSPYPPPMPGPQFQQQSRVAVGGTFYGTTPVNNSNNLAPSALGAFPTQQYPSEEVKLNPANHIPNHATRSPDSLYNFSNGEQPQIVAEQIMPMLTEEGEPNIRRINLVNRYDEVFDNVHCSTICVIFNKVEDVLTKPVLLSVAEARYVPAFNVTVEMAEAMRSVSEATDIDGCYDRLINISKKYSIAPAMVWFDNRITYLINKALKHRYGIDLDIPSYQRDRVAANSIISANGPMLVTEVEELAFKIMEQIFSKIELIEMVEDNKDYIQVVINSPMVTIPWSIWHNSETGFMRVRELNDQQNENNAQLFDILDQAWEIIGNEHFSILLTDMSSTRYRVYKNGTSQFHRGTYVFESLKF